MVVALALIAWGKTEDEVEAQAALSEALRVSNRVEALRQIIADYPETQAAPASLSFLARLDPSNRDRYLRQLLRDYPDSNEAVYAQVELLEVNPKVEPREWLRALDKLAIQAGGPSLIEVLEEPHRPEFVEQVRKLPPNKQSRVGYIFVEAQSKLATAMSRPEDSIRLARFNRVSFDRPNALQQLIIDFPDPTPNYNLHPEMEHWWKAPRTPRVFPPEIDRKRGLMAFRIETYEPGSLVDLPSLKVYLDGQDVRPYLAIQADFDLTYPSHAPLEVLTMELPLKGFEQGQHQLSVRAEELFGHWDVEF